MATLFSGFLRPFTSRMKYTNKSILHNFSLMRNTKIRSRILLKYFILFLFYLQARIMILQGDRMEVNRARISIRVCFWPIGGRVIGFTPNYRRTVDGLRYLSPSSSIFSLSSTFNSSSASHFPTRGISQSLLTVVRFFVLSLSADNL